MFLNAAQSYPCGTTNVETKRGLLVAGNEKLGMSVFHFDTPPVTTCPGRSKRCESLCYCRRGRFVFPQVIERLEWCYEQSKRDDFASRMTAEIHRKGCLAVRPHVSGDLYSPGYARKWLEIVTNCPRTKFWLYTRSWRIPGILEVLAELAKLPNLAVWFSADEETGYPPTVPEGVRVAWLMDSDEEPEAADLIFLNHPLRYQDDKRIKLDLICPTETESGRKKGTSCSTCQFCWPD
ncbi:hypothetical protein GobsT_50000 [Gemmata obscuriglobus]|nr:hypothetical protein GobsT_50000 [Gemmata obscuriglobus]VTS09521.1 Marine sediment metagenome DNA, contig: S01H4_L01320 OS=marine sediment metagenome GN=S01H4_16136 PE=4 SV=1 [Gemmata obscuriglobus UQM 2246]